MFKTIKNREKKSKCNELIAQAMRKRRKLAQSAIFKVCNGQSCIKLVK